MLYQREGSRERGFSKYVVELTNGLDLTFNKHFQLIDID